MDEYFLAIEAHQGFIARGDVLAIGLDDRFIRRQREGGAWVRVRKGAYCFTSTWRLLDDVERHRRLARAVLHSHGDAVVLSGISGLLMRPGSDAWGIDLSRVQVTRRDGRSGGIERDVVHHEGGASDDQIEVVDGLLLMNEARCLVEALSKASLEAGMAIADASLRAGRLDDDLLARALADFRTRSGARRVTLALSLADGRAASIGESRSRYVFWSQGLPAPEVQFEVWDHDGALVGTTDLALPKHRMLFEFDGRIKYGRLLKPGQEPGDAVFAEKLREDALRRATGWAVERATWADLSRPTELARRLRLRMTKPRDTA